MSDPLVMLVAMKRKQFFVAASVVAVLVVVAVAAGFVWTNAGQLRAAELAAWVDVQKPAVARLRCHGVPARR